MPGGVPGTGLLKRVPSAGNGSAGFLSGTGLPGWNRNGIWLLPTAVSAAYDPVCGHGGWLIAVI